MTNIRIIIETNIFARRISNIGLSAICSIEKNKIIETDFEIR